MAMTTRRRLIIAITFGGLSLLLAAKVAERSPSATSHPARTIAPDPNYPDAIKRADLVPGGQLVVDPFDADLRYYVHWSTGLSVSHDRGQSWRVLSRNFEFQFLFVHPLNGKLFAIIDYRWFETDKDGFLQHPEANKIVVSDDGRNWKDITRGNGYALLVDIEQDPEFPNRVQMSANGSVRPYRLRYNDDQCKSWRAEPDGHIHFEPSPFHPANGKAG
jgi:hypothetical protein